MSINNNNAEHSERVDLALTAFNILITIVLALVIVEFQSNIIWPPLASVLLGILAGAAFYRLLILLFGIMAIYIKPLKPTVDQLSKYSALAGLLIWAALFNVDDQGKLMLHGFGLYMFGTLYREIYGIFRAALISHVKPDSSNVKLINANHSNK